MFRTMEIFSLPVYHTFMSTELFPPISPLIKGLGTKTISSSQMHLRLLRESTLETHQRQMNLIQMLTLSLTYFHFS